MANASIGTEGAGIVAVSSGIRIGFHISGRNLVNHFFQNMEYMKSLNMEMIKAGMSDPMMAFDIATAKNPTALKKRISQAMKIKKDENDMIAQMEQQLQQF